MKDNEKKFDMEEVFVLWKKESKAKTNYFTGLTKEKGKIIGFYNTNKKNPQEPDLRISTLNEKNEIVEEYCSLWCNVGKESSKKYLSGKVGERKVVGFFNEKAEGTKQPYIRVYFQKEQVKEEVKSKDSELPF